MTEKNNGKPLEVEKKDIWTLGRVRLRRSGSTHCAHRAPQIPKTGSQVSAFGDDPSRKN